MQSVATRTRVNQITILVAISFLFYEMTNWQQGIWVVISTVVVASPFSTFLSFDKAKNRFLGTIVGLVIAAGLEYYLRFNPGQLPVVAVMIAFIAGFMVTKSYRYFIVIITICTCLGYTYMNMPYTSFAPMSFLIDRAMGVFVGVLIFYLIQRFLFGQRNSKLELLEESVETLGKLQKTLQAYITTPNLTRAYECAADIYTSTRALQSYVATSNLVFGTETTPELRFAKQVLLLNERAVRLLIDEPTVVLRRIDQLLQVVTAKLAR
jgi:uncharacterized membrane protein YccC